jgi:alkanesulfonate monooxygenase SsuD/methylene tetrahydromethanopterin reductase-like flavin-dependent oxidoreductase (luciferase family)
MDIGIGLPTTIPGVEGEQVLEWARRSEDAGFSALGTIDRIVYPNYEPLIGLAAAAAVTERIRLTTSIAILPYRFNAALVAKQAATLHHLSGGRLVLGVAVGGRADDYEASGVSMRDRGKRFEQMLEDIERSWRGGDVGPKVDPAPPILIGGQADAAFERAARYGAGWINGGGGADALAAGREKTLAAWKAAGREDEPRIVSLAYYGLGDDGARAVGDYLRDYYAFLGDTAERIAGSALTDADAVRSTVAAFEDAGCDELLFMPGSADPAQVELLAEAAQP